MDMVVLSGLGDGVGGWGEGWDGSGGTWAPAACGEDGARLLGGARVGRARFSGGDARLHAVGRYNGWVGPLDLQMMGLGLTRPAGRGYTWDGPLGHGWGRMALGHGWRGENAHVGWARECPGFPGTPLAWLAED